MRYYWKLLAGISLLFVVAAAGNTKPEYCFPENDLNIPVSVTKSLNGDEMDEALFNHVIDVVEEIYKPVIAELGGKLYIERKWADGTVNAYAQRQGSTYKVSMFGGLARHETVTPDGFAVVVCHEIGHHIGGAPKKKSWMGNAWASNEGQADYWGTTKCMKKVMEKLEPIGLDTESEDYAFALKECQTRFDEEKDQLLCARSAMSGKSLAELFRALRKLPNELHFWTVDKGVVTKTNDNHPAPQCRMDTYFAGALCDKSADAEISDSDATKGFCARKDGHDLDARSLCWFKPKE